MAQAEPAEMDTHVRTIVRQEVDAAVERLREEFAKGEAMHTQPVICHADHNRNELKRSVSFKSDKDQETGE